ncbi:MAG: VWD domain-containing protein, partial [Pararhodobacter sp.]
MSVSITGEFRGGPEDFSPGSYFLAGTMTVSGGSSYTFNPRPAGAGPFVVVGRIEGEGATNGEGSVTVTGSGSRITVQGSGIDGSAPMIEFGSSLVSSDAGTGTLNIRSGGLFQIIDPSATVGGGNVIGKNSGTGTINVSDGTFLLSGPGSSLTAGVTGGRGTINVNSNGRFLIETTSTNDDLSRLTIGTDNGTGALNIDGGFAHVGSGPNAGARIDIGRNGGSGRLEISGSTAAGSRDGLFVSGSASDKMVQMRVGADDGTGNATIQGGVLGLLNTGQEPRPEGGVADLPGSGGVARLYVGQDGGNGSFDASANALIQIEATMEARAQVGFGSGATGSLSLDAASLAVQSSETAARLDVGAASGNGMLRADNAATIDIQARDSALVRIGLDDGSAGRMDLLGGSQVLLVSTQSFAALQVGAEQGAGVLNAGGQDTQVTVQGQGEGGTAQLEIGSRGAGSQGDASISDGAAIDVLSAGGDANLLVGVQGGTGNLMLDDARIVLDAPRFAGIRIGGVSWPDEADQTGVGAVVMQNGALLTALSGAGNSSNMRIGGGEGSEGSLQMLSGARVDLGGLGFVGVAYPNDGFQGGTGTLELDGAGTQMTGLRTLFVGDGRAEGLVRLSDQAQIALGGLDEARSAALQIGRSPGSDGRVTLTEATVTLQAGNGTDADGRGTDAYAAIGYLGGTGRMEITGNALADPRAPVADPGTGAPHGYAQFGGSDTPFATIDIGRGLNGNRGDGVVVLAGGSFGTRNDGIMPGTDPENSGGGGSNIRIGLDNGTGRLEAAGGAHVFGMSGNDYSGFEIGLGRAQDGTRNIGVAEFSEGSRLDLSSAAQDAWALIGHEGGQGDMLISDSHAHLAGGRYAGFRIGTHWFAEDTDTESGMGALTLDSGATARVEATADAVLWVGGGARGQATADILSGSILDLDGDARGFVMVGGMAGFLPGTGGEGRLTVDGAGSALHGVQDMLIGFNAGTGAVQISDGGLIDVIAPANKANGEAFTGVGIGRARPDEPVTGGDGSLEVTGTDSLLTIAGPTLAALDVGDRGTGSVSVSGGGQIMLDSTAADDGAARLTLGRNGGDGSLTVDGASSAVSIVGSDSGIFMGRSGDTPEGGSAARLVVTNGARVTTDGRLVAGDEDGLSGPVLVALDDGTIAAQSVRMNEGSILAGQGTLQGLSGEPFMQMSNALLRPGDRLDATGTLEAGFGAMTIDGNVAKVDGSVWFDIGESRHDALTVDGVFAMSGGTLHANWQGAGAQLGDGGVRLIEASGGVVLDSVEHALMSEDHQLELRAEGTELWLVEPDSGTAPPAPSPLPPDWRAWFDWHDNPEAPAPALPNPGSGAGSRGDPHLLTFDGAAYDFHAAGEYVMTRATDGTGFELQARMAPVAQDASANIAAAVRLDGSDVMVAAGHAMPLFIDGEPVDLAMGGTRSVGHDFVYRSGNTWHLAHTGDGETDTGFSVVSVTVLADRVDIAVTLDPALQGQVEGLLGNFDGDPANDIALADGTLLERPLRFDDVYGPLRADWRVSTEEQSLFSYAPGEGPDSFFLPDYPTAMIGLDSFGADEIAAAETVVRDAGLAPGTLAFQNAVFDLLLTADTSYVDSARLTQAQVDNRTTEAPPVEIPQTDGGGLEGLLVLSGQVTGPDGMGMVGGTVTFQPEGRSVNLIRMTREDGAFAFDLSEGATGHLAVARAYDAAAGDPSITASDALDVLRLSVGLSPSFGPAAAQNYVAADINGDGRVGADDALEVLRHAVGLESDHVPRWVFVDADTDWEGL